MNCNFLFYLNAYSDYLPTTTPSLNNFKWSRAINGVPFTTENDQKIPVLPGVTTPNIVPYTFSAPVATTTAILNSTTTAMVTGSLTGISVGDLVTGTGIPAGTTVTTLVSTVTFTVTSANATVGATYTNNGQTFTVTGNIVAGTTLITTGSGLPTSSGILTLTSGTGDPTINFSSVVGPSITLSQAATVSASETLSFYNPASFIYMESDQIVSVIYNGGSPFILNPFSVNGLTQPAVFFMAGPVYSLTINNISLTTANIFFASMG